MTKGLGYLMGKFWHPMTKSNQRRKFIAEQKHEQSLKHQKELAEQYRKEASMREMRGLLCQTSDEREKYHKITPISFMYERPPGLDVDKDKEENDGPIVPPSLPEAGSDTPVGDTPSPAALAGPSIAVPPPPEELGATLPAAPPKKSDRIEDKFSFLKGAPTVGKYTRDVEVHHRPFGIEVRNVQCARCGQWGHRSGDRECRLREQHNPNDELRVKIEDPLEQMKAREQNLLGAAAASGANAEPCSPGADAAQQVLGQLSPHAKRRILKLFGLANGGGDVSSSSSSPSSSSSESDADGKHSRRKKKSRRHRKHRPSKHGDGAVSAVGAAASPDPANEKKPARAQDDDAELSHRGDSSDSDSGSSTSSEKHAKRHHRKHKHHRKESHRHHRHKSRTSGSSSLGALAALLPQIAAAVTPPPPSSSTPPPRPASPSAGSCLPLPPQLPNELPPRRRRS